MKAIIIQAKRQAYGVEDIVSDSRTLTIRELIEELSQYDEEAKVVLSHDNGYTYGGITERDIEDYEGENDEF